MSSEKKELTNEIILTLKNLSTYKYSPEKKKIIYLISQSDLKENKNNKELYIMNSDGSETKLISTPGESIAEPAFILKGEKIVYILNGELYAFFIVPSIAICLKSVKPNLLATIRIKLIINWKIP